MKGGFSAPGDYVYFKSQVPLHKIPIGTKQWRYYDFGPKLVPPLVCLPGIAGTAEVYYKQIMSLSMKGYRVISVDIPRVWNHLDWIQAFEKFLDAIDIHHLHLYGTALGGFLAQLFAQQRPRRVKSLILSNTFLETSSFAAAMPWAPVVSWTPAFLLKRYVLTGIHNGPHEPFIADSVDFVVSQVETLSREDLASRLTLTVDVATVTSLVLLDSCITVMDTNDYCSTPQELKDQVSERYSGARRAYLKTGGDFPFLSRPDEVNLHLQIHLRRVGVEARPDLVPGAPKDGAGSSGSEKNDKVEDPHDPSKEDRGNTEDEASKDADAGSYQSENSDKDEDADDNHKGSTEAKLSEHQLHGAGETSACPCPDKQMPSSESEYDKGNTETQSSKNRGLGKQKQSLKLVETIFLLRGIGIGIGILLGHLIISYVDFLYITISCTQLVQKL